MEIATFVVVDASSIGRFFVLDVSVLRLSLMQIYVMVISSIT
jgi:hypothetical protein